MKYRTGTVGTVLGCIRNTFDVAGFKVILCSSLRYIIEETHYNMLIKGNSLIY